MVTAPLFLVLALAAFVAVKYGSTKPGGLLLGVLVGLAMASTSLGPPILNTLNEGMTAAISSVSSVTGAR